MPIEIGDSTATVRSKINAVLTDAGLNPADNVDTTAATTLLNQVATLWGVDVEFVDRMPEAEFQAGFAALETGVGYEPEARALFARMTTQPDIARKQRINSLIVSLKASGTWGKLDALYVLAAHDAQAARLNWIQNAYNLTPNGTVTFTPDVGYQGDGSTGYLDTGFNPATAGGKHSLNDECHFVFLDPAVSTGTTGNFFGNTNTRIGRGTTALNTRSNNSTGQTFDTSPIDSLLTASRLSPTEYKVYRGSGLLTTHATTSVALSSENFSLLRASGFYSVARIQMAGFGAGLIEAQIAGVALP